MLNVVAIMGRLARDPELRQTTTGKNVASFRIACDRGRVTPTARARQTGWTLLHGTGRQSSSASISRKAP
nr:MAG TPA: hypothetical protein [Caudoviricetes sp.]